MKLSRTDPEAMTEAVYALARIASLLEYLPALDTETPQVGAAAVGVEAVGARQVEAEAMAVNGFGQDIHAGAEVKPIVLLLWKAKPPCPILAVPP